MEIRVVATVIVKPEFLSEVSDALHEVIEPSRQEVGCLQYELHRDIDHPETFVFYERWASKEALLKHNDTKHFVNFAQHLEGKLVALDIKRLKSVA
ncbi:putative quinol monooxygenase [Hafnia psychrotolerans]|jgi:quinol monooxygenase YgiN|uniref:Antibiotic biosynthesis monooxygenase n=1 Tax=Hafnia psychrotolerans TaxID=1477018 RepID=A0ABQ1GDG3_9GAMM|nr:putative quinol monooxygenase [Hafnia psychrotolerans]GGA41658.1 antibiotic biosynthesis monooxygenase [Hafnia psychrotolerans]